MIRPFYFGPADKPLFGIYHPPTAAIARHEAVVVCHPFGAEYFRAHRALRELSHCLSGAGFHTLRFDYYGTGDSAGAAADGTIEQWLDDVDSALTEAGETSDGGRLSLVGLRLGATLAVLASARRSGISRVVLWDPIISGREYVRELAERHRSVMATRPGGKGNGHSDAPTEALGTPLPDALRTVIAGIDLLTLGRSPAPSVALVSSDRDPSALALCDHLRELGAVADHEYQPGTKVWLKQDELDRVFVPQATLGVITSWLSR